MKKKLFRALPLIFVFAFALLIAGGAFAQSVFSDGVDNSVLPRNYNEDGSVSCGNPSFSASSVNFAEGDPSLLDYGEVLNVVIFICFSDEEISEEFPLSVTDEIADSFNGDCSLADYYSSLSYGEFTVTSVFPKKNTAYFVYKDNNSRSYY